MRVALVCERFDPSGGGLEQWAFQFACRLAERHHDVHVVAFRAAAPTGTALLSMHLLPWHRSRLWRARRVEAALPNLRADIVHDLGVGWACDILHPQAGSRLANRRRERRSQTYRERFLRSLRPEYWRWLVELRELERRQYKRGSTVIAVSGMVAASLRDLHGVSEKHIRLIPNGIDTNRFSPARRTPLREAARQALRLTDETLFLFAAHNPRLKGLKPLLRAMGRLAHTHPGARLAVIGCEAGQEYRRAVRDLGIEHSVVFAGFVEDTLPWFAGADAFVLPTYYDACSLTVLEAAACGLPVITSRYNGAAELMTHELEGFVLNEPDDHVELAAAIALLTNVEARSRMSAAARELGLRCGMDANVARIEEVYLATVGHRDNRGARL